MSQLIKMVLLSLLSKWRMTKGFGVEALLFPACIIFWIRWNWCVLCLRVLFLFLLLYSFTQPFRPAKIDFSSSHPTATKSQRLLGGWRYFPGFQYPFHLRGCGTLVGWSDVHFCGSRHLFPLLNQPHHLCKRELRRLHLRLLFTDIRVRECPLVSLRHSTRGRAPLLVGSSVYGLHKPVVKKELHVQHFSFLPVVVFVLL